MENATENTNTEVSGSETWNIYRKLQKARRLLSDLGLKPTGKNTYVGFEYWELSDFMPATQRIFDDLGLIGLMNTLADPPELQIVNIDDPAGEVIKFRMKYGKAEIKGAQEIQMIAGEKSYLRRYLWVDALELTVSDLVDSADRINPESKHNNGQGGNKTGQKSPNNNSNKGSGASGTPAGEGGQNTNKTGQTKPVWINAEQYNTAKACTTAEALLKMINQFEKDKLKMSDGQKDKLRDIYKTLLEAEKIPKPTVTEADIAELKKEAETSEDEHPDEQPEREKDDLDEVLSKKPAGAKDSTVEDELNELNKLL